VAAGNKKMDIAFCCVKRGGRRCDFFCERHLSCNELCSSAFLGKVIGATPRFAHSPGGTTMIMTRKDVTSVLGPVDEMTIAEIASTGASLDELREALIWLNNDEVLMGESRPLPGSRVAALIDLLEAEEIGDEPVTPIPPQ
jgi:hypothetical protein